MRRKKVFKKSRNPVQGLTISNLTLSKESFSHLLDKLRLIITLFLLHYVWEETFKNDTFEIVGVDRHGPL